MLEVRYRNTRCQWLLPTSKDTRRLARALHPREQTSVPNCLDTLRLMADKDAARFSDYSTQGFSAQRLVCAHGAGDITLILYESLKTIERSMACMLLSKA